MTQHILSSRLLSLPDGSVTDSDTGQLVEPEGEFDGHLHYRLRPGRYEVTGIDGLLLSDVSDRWGRAINIIGRISPTGQTTVMVPPNPLTHSTAGEAYGTDDISQAL